MIFHTTRSNKINNKKWLIALLFTLIIIPLTKASVAAAAADNNGSGTATTKIIAPPPPPPPPPQHHHHHNDENDNNVIKNNQEKQTLSLKDEKIILTDDIRKQLYSLGIIDGTFCHPTTNIYEPIFPQCNANDNVNNDERRRLLQDEEKEESESEENKNTTFYLENSISALVCVITAALAAGLTMGLLSIDPLLLHIKIKAGTKQEQQQAKALLPIVEQHHLLLVSLLLLNSIANEALPIFLDKIVPSVVAVIMSVTLVLFFGEIIPSAIFTGPNQMKIASQLSLLVKFVMILLYPISYPIAKLLDWLLPENEDGSRYNRGELSALVRIQYEERMAFKQHKKKERSETALKSNKKRGKRISVIPTTKDDDHVAKNNNNSSNNNDDGQHPLLSSIIIDKNDNGTTRRVSKLTYPSFDSHRDNDNNNRRSQQEQEHHHHVAFANDTYPPSSSDVGMSIRSWASASSSQREPSIHIDEVTMAEGALHMYTKTALEVYTPLHRVFAIPYDMILNESNIVKIYSSGHSRIPVYMKNPSKPKDITSICGILIAKQLIVVNTSDNRMVKTLPLYQPHVVPPTINLVDLINIFQEGFQTTSSSLLSSGTGGTNSIPSASTSKLTNKNKRYKGGHMALVCTRPNIANNLLNEGKALTKEAGFLGIITLEDCIEELLLEEIYDEYDHLERHRTSLAKWACKKWKSYVKSNKLKRKLLLEQQEQQVGVDNDKNDDPPPTTIEDIAEARIISFENTVLQAMEQQQQEQEAIEKDNDEEIGIDAATATSNNNNNNEQTPLMSRNKKNYSSDNNNNNNSDNEKQQGWKLWPF